MLRSEYNYTIIDENSQLLLSKLVTMNNKTISSNYKEIRKKAVCSLMRIFLIIARTSVYLRNFRT